MKAPPKSGKRGKKLKVSLKSSAGLPVAWRSASAKTCRVVGGALKLLKPGKCKVTATAAGTDQMLALTANYVIKVKK